MSVKELSAAITASMETSCRVRRSSAAPACAFRTCSTPCNTVESDRLITAVTRGPAKDISANIFDDVLVVAARFVLGQMNMQVDIDYGTQTRSDAAASQAIRATSIG